MTATALPESKPITLGSDEIAAYRENGFIKIENILTKEEAAFYFEEAKRIAVENKASREESGGYRKILNQTVNVWPDNAIMKALTLHPNVTAAAKALTGVPMRLWHDHVLCKDPHNGAATEWHQDQPYWPHGNSAHPISAWIALCDVPADKGCMSFIPKAHHRTDLAVQDLSDKRSMFGRAPDLEFQPKVTLPLRAGDCTFHHGRCPHMAGPNETDEYRVAHVVIFVDRDTTFSPATDDDRSRAKKHVITNPLNLTPGQILDHAMFPEI